MLVIGVTASNKLALLESLCEITVCCLCSYLGELPEIVRAVESSPTEIFEFANRLPETAIFDSL